MWGFLRGASRLQAPLRSRHIPPPSFRSASLPATTPPSDALQTHLHHSCIAMHSRRYLSSHVYSTPTHNMYVPPHRVAAPAAPPVPVRAQLPATCLRVNSRAMTSAPTAGFTAEELLSSFINYERLGMPKRPSTPYVLKLDRMFDVAAAVGNPQNSLKAVHITGSKGKGSTAATLTSILAQSGYTCGLYTSPHVFHLTERIQIAQPFSAPRPIEPATLDALARQYVDVIRDVSPKYDRPVTYFEAITALGLRAFADARVDVAVLEVGIGGEFDATNILTDEQLLTAVITPVTLEHVEMLGPTPRDIALTKSQITKRGRPCVVARQPYPDAMDAVRETTDARGATLVLAQDTCVVDRTTLRYEVLEPGGEGQVPAGSSLLRMRCSAQLSASVAGATAPATLQLSSQLCGTNHVANLEVSIAAALQLRSTCGLDIPDEMIVAGVQAASLPGRFQVLPIPGAPPRVVPITTPSTKPRAVSIGGSNSLVEVAPKPPVASSATCAEDRGPSNVLVLDAAHTQEAMRGLVGSFGEAMPQREVVVVLAVAFDKQYELLVQELVRLQPSMVVFTQAAVQGSTARSRPPGQLMAAWDSASSQQVAEGRPRRRAKQLMAANMASAMDMASREVRAIRGNTAVLVTGSFYAVSEALKWVERETEAAGDFDRVG